MIELFRKSKRPNTGQAVQNVRNVRKRPKRPNTPINIQERPKVFPTAAEPQVSAVAASAAATAAAAAAARGIKIKNAD